MPLLPVHARLKDYLLEGGEAVIEELDRGYQTIGSRAGTDAKRTRPPRRTTSATAARRSPK
jgi:hypothetical protein